MRFDLVVKGGEVLDPGSGYRGPLDVAVHGDRIAAVEPSIPAETAVEVIDAKGLYVTPGLVDLHTHVYPGATYWGLDPDPLAASTGTTTWVDAGSAGALTLPAFRELVANSSHTTVQVLALLHISAFGLVTRTGESADIAYLDPDLCAAMAEQNRDLVIGLKVRIDRNAVGNNGLEPLRRVRQAGDRCELPLMAHIGSAPHGVNLQGVVDILRPGDILTHCATSQSINLLDRNGRVHDAARRAHDIGVVFDVGHGGASFSFRSAEALLEAGIAPDVISSDAHRLSVQDGALDLPTCLSKFLHLGMSLPQVVKAATTRAAEVIQQYPEIGSLRRGTRADIAIFDLEEGNFKFHDTDGTVQEATKRLHGIHTIVKGRKLHSREPKPAPSWINLLDRPLLRASSRNMQC
jgi:dihydroorotase